MWNRQWAAQAARRSDVQRVDLRPASRPPSSALQWVESFDESGLYAELFDSARYPAMPAGLLRLVMRQLKAGVPACFHVPSRISAHWVLIVVVPVAEGFLLARLRPASTATFGISRSVWAACDEAEQQAARAGAEPAQAAEAGADRIVEILTEAGSPGISALPALLLRTEAGQVHRFSTTHTDGFGPMAELAEGMGVLNGQTTVAIGSLPRLREVTAELACAAQELAGLAEDMSALTRAAREGADLVRSQAPVLANTSEVMQPMAATAGAAATSARTTLLHAVDRFEQASSWICLSRMVENLIADEAAHLVGGFVGPGVGTRISLLWRLLQHVVIEMAVAVNELPVSLLEVREAIDTALEEFTGLHRWLGRFRLLVTREGLWDALDGLTSSLDQRLVGIAGLERLRETERSCRIDIPLDIDALASLLQELRAALEAAQLRPSGTASS